jgi:outer membrane protein OmpA-like peptidoglycan-associated protein
MNKKYSFLLILILNSFSIAYCQEDISGSKDHKFFPKFKGFYITSYSVDSNSSYEFINPENNKPIRIKGLKTVISYKLKKGLIKSPEFSPSLFWRLPLVQGNSNLRVSRIINRNLNDDDFFYVIDKTNSDIIWVHEKVKGPIETRNEYILTIIDNGTPIENLNDLTNIDRVELYSIYFKTNQFKFEKESEPTINNIVSFLTKEKNIKITIEGAADTTGSPKYNLELSRKRATYIKDAIVSKGIDSKRLKIIGIGESMDKRDEDKVFELQLNRRTTLIRN